MPFRLETAVVALRRAADVLARTRETLDTETRRDLAQLIAHYGPQIAEADAINAAPRAQAFLDELWLLRDRLPPAAVDAMARAQGSSQSILAPLDEQGRADLLASLVRVADMRHFIDAGRLAGVIIRTVEPHMDRLAPEERAAWERLQAAYAATGDAESFVRAAESLLGGYPAIAEPIERGKSWHTYRGGWAPPDTGPGADGTQTGGATPADEEIVRYGNVYFPATVLLSQQLVPLVVHIARDMATESVVDAGKGRMTVHAGELTLILHAEGFRLAHSMGGAPVAGVPAARVVSAAADRDCEPVVFFLVPESAGTKHIGIDVYQAGRNAGTLMFDTVVIAEAPIGPLANVTLEPLPISSPSPGIEAPDLELRVTLSADRRTLSYMLHSPGSDDYHFKPAGQVVLLSDPRDFLQRDLDRLSELAGAPVASRGPEQSRRAAQELDIIGIKLYETLFSPELKAEYRRLRAAFAGKSLLITSDEPWVPWEMVKPCASDSDGTVLYDDPHLCETFRVSRWLAGRGPRGRIALTNGALVLPPTNLQAAQVEAGFFAGLHRRQWDVSFVEPPYSTVAEVEDSFRAGQTQLFHFACHGNFDGQDPDESRLKLADGFFSAGRIVGDVQAGLRRARPVVFLNACHSGETGFALTRLGGWAQRFIEAGASAFVGSLWEINDELAARFAVELYSRLWGLEDGRPMTLGEAFYGARMAVKALDPANPTWLAYVLYGDPRGRVVLGGKH